MIDVEKLSYPLPKSRRINGPILAMITQDLTLRYERGMAVRELAVLTGRSYGWVHRLLTGANVTMRARGGRRQPNLTLVR